MHNDVNPRLVWLYNKALICRTFPAYRLEDLDDAPIGEIMQAMELLDVAMKVKHG